MDVAESYGPSTSRSNILANLCPIKINQTPSRSAVSVSPPSSSATFLQLFNDKVDLRIYLYVRTFASAIRTRKSEMIYRWIFFPFSLFTGLSIARPPPFRIDGPSRFRAARVPSRGTSDLFLFSARSFVSLSLPSGGGARVNGTFFHSARECVAGINQSMSPGIRVYGTPGGLNDFSRFQGWKQGARE